MSEVNSILNYRGNSDLGGFDGLGTPMIGSTKDHYGEFANIIRDVQNQNFLWNTKKYEQAIADRDASTQLLARQDMSLPLEEDDRKVVEKEYQNIADIMMQYNGNPYNNSKGRQELQKAVTKFQQLRTLGQSRYVESAKQRNAIASELDPETREKMQNHLSSQMSQGIYKVPDPYLKELDYDLDKVLYNPGMEVIGKPEYVRDGNGVVYEKTVKATDPKKIIDYYSLPRLMEGNNKTLPDQIDVFYNYITKDGRLDEEKIVAINSSLNDINKKNGWAPGNPYYQEPIATKDATSGEISMNGNPVDFAKKMALYAYGNMKKEEQLPSKEGQNAFKTRAQEKQALSAVNKNNAEAYKAKAVGKAQASLYGEQARLAHLKGDTESFKLNKLKEEGTQPVATVIQEFDKVKNESGYKPAKEFLGNIVTDPSLIANPATFQAIQANIDGYDVKELSSASNVIKRMLSTAATDKNGHKNGLSSLPTKVYVLKPKDGSIGGMRLIGIDKKGNPKVVDVKEGSVGLMESEDGFKGGDKFLQKTDAVRDVADDLLSKYSSSGEDEAPDAPQQQREIGTYEINGNNYYYDGVTLTLVP